MLGKVGAGVVVVNSILKVVGLGMTAPIVVMVLVGFMGRSTVFMGVVKVVIHWCLLVVHWRLGVVVVVLWVVCPGQADSNKQNGQKRQSGSVHSVC